MKRNISVTLTTEEAKQLKEKLIQWRKQLENDLMAANTMIEQVTKALYEQQQIIPES